MAEASQGVIPNLSDTIPNLPPNDPLARYPRMLHPHRYAEFAVGEVSRRYLLDRRMEQVLTALFEDEPIAAQTMFYFKPPGARGQALHQDNFYLRVKPGTCIGAWLAVDNATPENGGMVVVPQSHLLDIICPTPADLSRSFVSDRVTLPEAVKSVIVTLPLLIVTLANVMLFSVVTVLPNWIAVLPSVIGVLKLLSNWDNGMAAVAVPKEYGTVMLEPHSQFVFKLKCAHHKVWV